MRLKEIEIVELFGLFHHRIPLNLSDRITIIHGPNGFGKTAILRLTAGVFESQYSALRQLPYKRLRFDFDDASPLFIERQETSGRRDTKVALTFQQDSDTFTLQPQERSDRLLHALDDYVAGLQRVEQYRWVYQPTGELLDADDVIERFGDDIPLPLREGFDLPEWLKQLTSTLDVHLIRANRLESPPVFDHRRVRGPRATLSVVARFAQDLADQIRTTLATYAELSQSLDRSFPRRLVTSQVQPQQSMDDIQKRLTELETKRRELTDAGLLDKEERTYFDLPSGLDETKRDVLSVYIRDVDEKLSVFDNLLRKIHSFKTILNKRFLFKKVDINKTEGIVFQTLDQHYLSPSSLSSGEQHEVVLLFQLLFHVKPNSLILIDEPELSLHVAWQQQFLKDLAQVTSLSDFDVLIATHSPQIISDRWDLTVELEHPAHHAE